MDYQGVETLFSPDDKWEILILRRYGVFLDSEIYDYLQLCIRSADNSTEYIAYEKVSYYSAVGGSTVDLVGWSRDGESLFFVNPVFIDGAALYPFYSGLTKLHLATREQIPLAPEMLGDFLLMEEMDTLVYLKASQDQWTIFVRSLKSSYTRSFEIPLDCVRQAGDIIPSPDNTQFVFGVYQDDCGPENGTAFLVLTPEDGRLEVIASLKNTETAIRWPKLVEWATEGIVLSDMDGQEWLLDPKTGELVSR